MGVFDRIGRAWGELTSKSAGSPVQGTMPLLGAYSTGSGMAVNQATAMAVSAINACVSVRARDFARCTPRLLGDNASRNDPPNTTNPVAKLLRRPNWVQTWPEFAIQMQTAFLLRENAYAVILRDGRGAPTALIPVNPDAVLMLEAADGQIFYQTNRVGLFQLAALRNMPMAIPTEDMFHLRGMSFNMLMGASRIGLARDTIGLAIGLQQQQSRFMDNGARPSGVLKVPKSLSPEGAARLKAQWQEFRSGVKNAGSTAVLEDGVDFAPMQLSSVDLQFVEQLRLSIEDVARFFGVPLWKIGVPGAEKIDFEQAEQAYVNQTVMPDLELWEQKFEMAFDLDANGLRADFDERNLLRARESTRINNGRLGVMSGLYTQNEWRRSEGLPEMPNADELLVPVNLAAVGSDMSGTAPDGAGRPEAGTLPDPGAANQPKE